MLVLKSLKQIIEKRNKEVVDKIIENLASQYTPMDAISGIKIVPY